MTLRRSLQSEFSLKSSHSMLTLLVSLRVTFLSSDPWNSNPHALQCSLRYSTAFPPGLSLNKNACQQLAHEDSHQSFFYKFTKIFWAVLWKVSLSRSASSLTDERSLTHTAAAGENPDSWPHRKWPLCLWDFGLQSKPCPWPQQRRALLQQELSFPPCLVTFVHSSLTLRAFVDLIQHEPTL